MFKRQKRTSVSETTFKKHIILHIKALFDVHTDAWDTRQPFTEKIIVFFGVVFHEEIQV